jgi:putative DNA primase/helicase
MSNDAFAPLNTAPDKATKASPADDWQAIVPVPDDAPPPLEKHSKKGKAASLWQYKDAAGKLLFIVLRFNKVDGSKEFLPVSFCRNAKTGKAEWQFKGLSEPRPLYNLDQIAVRTTCPVVICEGEKAADAAAKLLPDCVTTTSPNGSKSARKADWSILAGRDVIIWPDADDPGADYAATVAELCASAGAKSICIIQPTGDLDSGFDAADAHADGWTTESVTALLSAAKKHEMSAPDSGVDGNVAKGKKPKRTPQKDQLLSFLDDGYEFWQDESRESFVTYPVDQHFEQAKIRDRFFKNHLAGLFYRKTGAPLSASGLDDALRVCEALAQDGPQYATWRRTAADGGNIYFDLCDSEWRSVKITRQGWVVGQFPHVKFLRSSSARALPEPQIGGDINGLRGLINIGSTDDFVLALAWLVAAMRPTGPYPLLCVSGEQGSGKSASTDMLARLIDNEIGKKRTVSKEERDLVIAAVNAHVLAFDNMSSVPNWISDALCRLSTGGGFATRQLHSDSDQLVLEASRPVILNGIPDLTGRADLADRSISLFLPRLPEGSRQTEAQIKASFDREWPLLLGCLCSGVSSGLRSVDSVKLANPPRMADFAQWATACMPGLGFEGNDFLAAYSHNRADVAEIALENDPFASQVVKTIKDHRATGYVGTAARLFELVNEFAPQSIKSMRVWPSSEAAFGKALRRAAPLIRAEGFEIDLNKRTAKERQVSITPRAE